VLLNLEEVSFDAVLEHSFEVRGRLAVPQATPEMGQHTAEVLAGLGYGAEAIADLRVRGVV